MAIMIMMIITVINYIMMMLMNDDAMNNLHQVARLVQKYRQAKLGGRRRQNILKNPKVSVGTPT